MKSMHLFRGLAFALSIASGLTASGDAFAANDRPGRGAAQSAALAGVPAQSDVDGDGKSDILWHNAATGVLYALRMNGLATTGAAVVEARPDLGWKVAAVADIDGDGKADVVWQHAATGEVYALLMNGAAIANEGLIHTEPDTAWKIVGSGDFDGDGKADLLWRNRMTGDVFLQLMNGLAAKGGGVIYSEPNSSWQIHGVADFDGDGRADVLWRNVSTGEVFILLVNGTTIAGGGVIYSEPNGNWQIQSAADFNGDGRADILWRNVATGDVFMMLMNGLAITGGGVFYAEPSAAWRIVATGDYDGNGRADILWRNASSGQVFLMLMNGAAIAGGDFVYTEPDQNWKVTGTVPAALPANCVIKDKAALWSDWVPGTSFPISHAPLHENPLNSTWSFKFLRNDLFSTGMNASSTVTFTSDLSGDAGPALTLSVTAAPCEFAAAPPPIQCQRATTAATLDLFLVAHTHEASDATVTNADFCRAPAASSDSFYVNVRFTGPPDAALPPDACAEAKCPYRLLYQRLF